jgi:hypothetical protein
MVGVAGRTAGLWITPSDRMTGGIQSSSLGQMGSRTHGTSYPSPAVPIEQVEQSRLRTKSDPPCRRAACWAKRGTARIDPSSAPQTPQPPDDPIRPCYSQPGEKSRHRGPERNTDDCFRFRLSGPASSYTVPEVVLISVLHNLFSFWHLNLGRETRRLSRRRPSRYTLSCTVLRGSVSSWCGQG